MKQIQWFRPILTFFTLSVYIFLASCSSIPTSRAIDFPLDFLAEQFSEMQKPDLYLIIKGKSQKNLQDILPESVANQIIPLLQKTRQSNIAITLGRAGESQLIASLVGDYPSALAAWSLASNKDWRREGVTFVHKTSQIQVALPSPTLILVRKPWKNSTGFHFTDNTPPSIIPQILYDFFPHTTSKDGLVVYAVQPLKRLANQLLGINIQLPLEGLLITSEYNAADEEIFRIIFHMQNKESLRLYRSALKLAWYGMVWKYFTTKTAELRKLTFTEKDNISVSDTFTLSESDLSALLQELGSSLALDL